MRAHGFLNWRYRARRYPGHPSWVGLPALLAGGWLGLKLFGRLNEAAFRKVVLVLPLALGGGADRLASRGYRRVAAVKDSSFALTESLACREVSDLE